MPVPSTKVFKAASASLEVRRFGNLARAEQHHADAIRDSIRYLGGQPILEHNRKVAVPKSAVEADEVCRKIELAVINVYESLIGMVAVIPGVLLMGGLESIRMLLQRLKK